MGHKKGNYALDTIVFVLIDLDEFTLKYKTQLAHRGFWKFIAVVRAFLSVGRLTLHHLPLIVPAF